MKDLYTFVVGSQDRKRHLISATGEDSAFPRALCTAGIRLRDDSAAKEGLIEPEGYTRGTDPKHHRDILRTYRTVR